ncbi:MAG: hypothetical protein JO133_14415, partial [Burkholderiaceae bacterium]|nr:hypothetical protein [Burkholderiaceae bacterium]
MSRLKISAAIVAFHWPLVAVTAAACLMVALSYAAIAPQRYTATSTLVLDPVATGSDASLRTELDLLRSEQVAQRVAGNLRLGDSLEARKQFLESGEARGTLPEFLAQQLAEHARVVPVGDGGLVRVSFSAAEPALAARVANAYPQAYGEVSLEMRAAAIRSGVERAGQDLALLRMHLQQARLRSAPQASFNVVALRAGEQLAHLAKLALQSRSGVFAIGSEAPEPSVPSVATALSAASSADPDSVPLPRIDLSPPAASELQRRRDDSPGTAEQELRLAQQNLERAEERLAHLSAESVGAPFPAQLLVSASVPQASSKPGTLTLAAIGTAAGLLLGLMAAMVAERLDRRVRRIEDVARLLGVA